MELIVLNILNKIRLFFTISAQDKEDIISKGYGAPIKVISNGGGHGYPPIELVPRGLTYDTVYVRESVYLTDKNNQVRVSKFIANSNDRCVYCENEIQLLGGLKS